MSPRLSENKASGDCTGTRSSNRSDFTNCSSVALAAIAQFPVSMEERATMRFFVELQEIGLALRNIKKAPMEVQSVGLSA